jgi:hypothetical protein
LISEFRQFMDNKWRGVTASEFLIAARVYPDTNEIKLGYDWRSGSVLEQAIRVAIAQSGLRYKHFWCLGPRENWTFGIIVEKQAEALELLKTNLLKLVSPEEIRIGFFEELDCRFISFFPENVPFAPLDLPRLEKAEAHLLAAINLNGGKLP